jgi:hypothetical protein
MSNALYGLGEADRCEDLLRAGCEVFPDAVHLPIQLAMVLADQGRLPEALDVLDDLPEETVLIEDLHAFVTGFRANLLATLGRWSDADAVLRDGLGRDPQSELLHSTREEIARERRRAEARGSLLRSWRAVLDAPGGRGDDVEAAIEACGASIEESPLVVAAARRMWRAFRDADPVRPQSPEPWAAAMLLCVLELDGAAPTAAAMARATRTSADTVRSAARRGREFLAGMSPELRERAFAAEANPRLDDPPRADADDGDSSVVRFPGGG